MSISINVLFFLFCQSFSVFKTFLFISFSKLSWHILKKSVAADHYCKNAAVECCQRQIGCFDLLVLDRWQFGLCHLRSITYCKYLLGSCFQYRDIPACSLYGIAVYSSNLNRQPCQFISSKVCLLISIKGERKTLLEINLQGRLFRTLWHSLIYAVNVETHTKKRGSKNCVD